MLSGGLRVLGWRLLGAFGLIAPLILILWMDDQCSGRQPGIWLVPLAIFVAGSAAAELVGLFTDQVAGLRRSPAAIAAVLLMVVASLPTFWPNLQECPLGIWGFSVFGVFVALAVLLLAELANFTNGDRLAERIGITILGVVSVTLPLCCFLNLRIQVGGRLGILLIVSAIFVVKCSDAGAYFVGKAFGRHKLAPRVSPGKTWEGAVGGLIAAATAAWAFHYWILPRFIANSVANPTAHGGTFVLIYAVCLYSAGVLGDLAESMLKRSAAKKDSAGWLPGLGGFLDVIDSILWAAPVAYLFWAIG